MDINIGAKKPIDGTQVFLVGRLLGSSELSFALLYDKVNKRRVKRNIQKGVDPYEIVEAIGANFFKEILYPSWGTVWLCSSKIRGVKALSAGELEHSSNDFGAKVVFDHDPEPEDEHAGFLLFGMSVESVTGLLAFKSASTMLTNM
jgi:hypothetical protein